MYSNVRYNLYLTLLYILHSIGQHNISFLSRCVMLCSVYLTLAQRGTMTDWKGLFNAMLRRPLVRGLFKAMLKWPHTKGWLWLSEGVNLPLCWNDQKHNRDIRTRSRFWKWGGTISRAKLVENFLTPPFAYLGSWNRTLQFLACEAYMQSTLYAISHPPVRHMSGSVKTVGSVAPSLYFLRHKFYQEVNGGNSRPTR